MNVPALAPPLRVALLGCGVVGSEVVRQLDRHHDELASRVGAPLEIAGIAVRRPQRVRHLPVDSSLFTSDAAELVARDDIDIVIEVVGGIEPVRSWMLAAMASGKSVITANKALLAEDGVTLHQAAAAADVDLYYEASVAGAIPLLRPLRESLAGDRVHRVLGIVNGTTNYILTRMEETGASFSEALEEATALGMPRPIQPLTSTVSTRPARRPSSPRSPSTPACAPRTFTREGIGAVTISDMASAKAMGATVKLLAIAERAPTEAGISVRVHPAMIPLSHPLAGVREAYNAGSSRPKPPDR